MTRSPKSSSTTTTSPRAIRRPFTSRSAGLPAARSSSSTAPGDVLELDRAAGSPADLLVNGRLIARGEVVVVDEDFALRVTEIVANPAGS